MAESRLLPDSDSGQDREVDIVLEGMVGDVRSLISIEVINHRRPASTEWVERMLGKHARMPTQKLALVSWSGFYQPALAKVRAAGRPSGRVDTTDARLGRRSHRSCSWTRFTTPECAVLDARGHDGGHR